MKLAYVRKALWDQASSCLHRPQQGRRPPSSKNAVFLSLLQIFSIKREHQHVHVDPHPPLI